MPERPPKKWFNRCVKRVSEDRPEVDDPNALCGWLWHHGMKRVTKKAILEGEKKYKHDPEVKVRRRLIKTPKVEAYFDKKASGLIRILWREDKTKFPEFAFYPRPSEMIRDTLRDAGFKEETRGKWVLRTNKFSIFVFL